jgi:agmatinase
LDYGFHGSVVSQIEAHAKTILDSGAEMLTFGGDHFVTYPLLRAHAAKHGPIALVHFDAHTDTWPDEDGRLDHGTMFSRAIKENLIDTEHSIQVGIRTHNSNTKGVTILDAPWVHENGVNKVIKKIIEVVKDRPAYLTFDIDGLDPAYAPGTGTPVSGGLTSAQALGIIRGLDGLNFIGADVVEVAPVYDHAEITAIIAATIAHDYLVIRAKQKMKKLKI